jgi:autotransporter-associated beta strand protein
VATWKNTVNSDFNTGSNWTGGTGPGGIPGTGDNATFSAAVPAFQPDLSGPLTIQGLTFATGGWAVSSSTNSVLTLTNTGTGATSAINNTSTTGTTTISARIELGGAAASTATFTQNGGRTMVLSNNITSTNAIAGLSLIRSGTGNVIFTMSGDNSYSGTTTLGAGVLVNINSATAISTGALATSGDAFIDNTSGTSALFLANNNAINLSGGNLTYVGSLGNTLNFGSGVLTISGADRTLNVSGLASAAVTVNSIDADTTGRALTKSGARTLVITGAAGANFQGGFKLTLGTVQIGDKAALGTGLLTATSGTLQATTDLSGANKMSNAVLLTALTISGANNIEIGGKVTGATGGNRTLTSSLNGGLQLTLNNVDISNDTTNARTLIVAGTGNTTINGVIANGVGTVTANGLTKSGAGTLTLTNSGNSYTGLTTVSAGTLAYGASNVIGSGGVTVSGTGAILDLGLDQSDTVGTVILDGGSISGIGTSTLTSTANFDMRNGTVSAILAGTLGLTKTTAGTVTLSGTNTYSGNTAINGGILQISGVNSLGNGGVGNAISFNGGTLNSTGNSYDLGANRVVTLAGAGTIQTDADILTVSAPVNIAANLLTVTGAGGTIISSAINDAGLGGSLTKSGAGTLTLTNNGNSYTGLTTVTGGTLAYGASNVIGSGGVTVDGAGAILDLGANQSDTVGAVIVDGGGSITGTGTSTLTSTADFDMRSGAVSAILAGSVGLTKTTAGTVTLSGTNTYAGLTTINNGILSLGSAGALGSGGNVTFDGGVLQYTAASAGLDLSSNIINSASAIKIDANGQTITFNNPLSGTNTGGLTLTGTGTLVLAGTSTYSGPTTLTGGALQISNPLSLQNSALFFNGGALNLRSDTSVTFVTTSTTLGAGTISVDNNGSAATGNTLSLGAFSVVAGTLTVTSGNNYALSLGAGTQSGAGTTTFANAATLTLASFTTAGGAPSTLSFTGTGNATITGIITQVDANPLTLSHSGGAGALILQSASPTITGPVSITAGSIRTAVTTNAFGSTTGISLGGTGVLALRADANATFGNGVTPYPITMASSGGGINVDQNTGVVLPATITLGTVSMPGAFTLNTTGANGVSLSLGAITASTASNKTITNTIAAPGTLTIASYAETDASARTIIFNGAGATTVTGAVTQNGANALALTYSGTGTLRLNGNNSYTGLTTVSGGALTLAGDNIAATGGVTLNGGGRLNVNSPTALGTGAFNWNGGILDNTSGAPVTLTTNNLGALPGDSFFGTAGGTAANSLTFGGTAGITIGLGRTITMAGTGNLSFGGPLIFTNPGNYDLRIQGGGAAGSVSFNGITLTTSTSGAAASRFFGPNGADGNYVITGPIIDGFFPGSSLTVSAATTTLSGAGSTSTGGVILTGGKLNLNSSTALGTMPLTYTGGTLDNTSGTPVTMTSTNAFALNGSLNFSTATGTINNSLTLGPGTVSTAASRTFTLNGAGALGFGGPLVSTAGNANITLTVTNGAGTAATTALSLGGFTLSGGGATTARTNTITGSGNVNITGAISDGSAAGSNLTYSGTGRLTASGNSSLYTGTTTLSGTGTLTVGHALALGAASAPLVLSSGVLDLATDTSVAAHNTTIPGAVTTTIRSNKATPASAGITQTLGTLSIGAGTLNVTAGANVSGGSPEVAFGAATVTGGATFNPTTADLSLDSIAGAGQSINLNGSSGDSTVAGTLTATTVNRSGTGPWNLNGNQNYTTLNANTGTTTNVNGTFTTGGTSTVNVNAGAVVNFGTSETLAALNIGDGAVVSLTASPSFADVGTPTVAAVPEPGSMGLLVLGALGVLMRRRRKA